MPLNEAKGNMYDFITHTWNTVKGKCPHDCSYCYMKRWGKQREPYFDMKELKTDLGEDNFIFVGSSCDLFAYDIPNDWIMNTLSKMCGYDNQYLLQSKNPVKLASYINDFFTRPTIICTTIETNRMYPVIMGQCPSPLDRAESMSYIKYRKFVTIEPIIDFDLKPMVELIKKCNPEQVNIGADSGNNGLPEPPIEKVLELIDRLKGFTIIAKKKNLDRLVNKIITNE